MNVYAIVQCALGMVAIASTLTSVVAAMALMFCVNPSAYTKRERWTRLWHIVSSNAPEECYTAFGKKMLRVRMKATFVLFMSAIGIALLTLAFDALKS